MIDVPLHVPEAQGRRTTPERAAERSCRLAAEAVLVDITETFGVSFDPDLFAALQARPAYLGAAWELFKDDVDLDTLDARTKRIIALAITTNRSGTYQIAAFPHAFRLSPVGPRRCETILSLIGMFHAFTRYLSDAVFVRNKTNEMGHGFA